MTELTILMPCLNEAETLAVCIRKARGFLAEHDVQGEVLIADNGSTDGSQQIAEAEGARVVPVPRKGYGAALAGGIAAAKGRFVIMGDADDSYDFSDLMPFLEKLREGAQLVMGNRFDGGIAPGAMPPLHRFLGNPVLSFAGRLFFRTDIGDFHCGLRGFDRDAIRALNLRTSGMEFASEMVVKATLEKLRIAEVPTTLSPDGRTRAPHLRSWRDGWRHLRFLLLYSPRWLFLYPGLILMALGTVSTLYLLPGPVQIAPDVEIDIHTLLVGAMCVIVGLQAISFAIIARSFATRYGFIPRSATFGRLLDAISLERILFVAVPIAVLGIGGIAWSVINWASTGFGPLSYSGTMRVMIISMTAVVAGIQLAMTGFLSSMMNIPMRESGSSET
ncbi:glycosyltransferase family 2 protein [Cucumibacter marinus]|uniref:glycosyltransferase family 2 protein n=1 Tax=Cucumibacter marinus TaxID=1121252 RepID=UPI00040C5C19|nr:glycosyltransferase family 2 protein [Cucumibacter marinus]